MEEKPRRKKYSKEFKESAIKLSLEHPRGVAGAAADLGLVEPMLHRWRRAKRMEAGNRPAFPGNGNARDAELAEWKRRALLAEEEREILKKALGLFTPRKK
jgi:transposase-like protein